MDMDHYRDNLEHVVRPETRSERNSSPSVQLTDYEALYVATEAAEYAAYGDGDDEAVAIARSIEEYVDMVVRSEGKTTVNIYLHTDTARETFMNIVLRASSAVLPDDVLAVADASLSEDLSSS